MANLVRGRQALVSAFLGADGTGGWPSRRNAPPHPIPPHLLDAEWYFACRCGHRWTDRGDAQYRMGSVRSPSRTCPQCGRWAVGRSEAL